jgi:hypothetical protein
LSGKVFGIDSAAKTRMMRKSQNMSLWNAHDIEAVAVVGGDDDEGVLIFTNFLQMLDGSTDGVVELKEFTKSTVII